jgi:nucleoside-diphosphate-sugar epimerase
VLAALDAPAVAAGQVFNVGEPTTDTMREYAQRILRSAGCDAELVTVPDEDVPADLAVTRSTAQHFLCDSGKLARTLGWQPADTELSVGRSVRWHLAHPPESADTDFTPDDHALAER